jgi:hypothetical protein
MREVALIVFVVSCWIVSDAATVKAAPVWEYCFVESNAYVRRNNVLVYGVMVHLPGGRQVFQRVGVGNTRVAIMTLNRLGASGWEVVSHASYFGNLTWTLKRRKQ